MTNSLPIRRGDLSAVLVEIDPELADDQAWELLLAGERLLRRHMGLEGPAGCPARLEEIAGISRRSVVGEAQQSENGSSLTESALRRRWKHMSSYLLDLIAFGVRSSVWSEQHPEQMHDLQEAMAKTPAVPLIERIAYEEVDGRHQNPTFRLQVAFQALFSHDPTVTRVLRQADQIQVNSWRAVYSDILNNRGLRLRPGVNVEDLTLALHLVGKALAFRAVLWEEESHEGYAKAIDRETETTFLSPLILALLVGFIDPGDGRTLRQAASAILGDELPSGDETPSNSIHP
ncbi:hypothetical protein [Nonomuraea guangzhouensis]|uniref:Uncharacterized protein n=1 Tax=Nonomuraea guangzhouensis TaxID=1291555 RepID=A0ABW4GXH0_9ACTN|nr:hypothetical protein [Nonomuraea guangzhouensis]